MSSFLSATHVSVACAEISFQLLAAWEQNITCISLHFTFQASGSLLVQKYGNINQLGLVSLLKGNAVDEEYWKYETTLLSV